MAINRRIPTLKVSCLSTHFPSNIVECSSAVTGNMLLIIISLSLLARAHIASALTTNCSLKTFEKIVPPTATVISAEEVATNGTFIVPVADTGFPTDPARLPALCAVQVEMTTDANTTFNYGLFLPNRWNGRFL
jgi:feruloyl esterase